MATRFTGGTNPVLTSDLSAALAAGDTLYIGRGDVEYTGADLSGTDLLLVYIQPAYAGNPAETLKFTADRTSTGHVYVLWGGARMTLESSSTAGVIFNLTHNPSAGGSVTYGNMDCNNFFGKSGEAILSTTADVNNVFLQGDCRCVVPKGSAFTGGTWRLAGNAFLDLDRDVGTLVQGSAVPCIVRSSCTPATLEIQAGRTVDYRGGNIATALVVHADATLDISNCDVPPTIADLQEVGGDWTLRKKPNQADPTFSANTVNNGTMRYEYV